MARYVIDPSTLVGIAREQLVLDPSHRLVAPNSLRSAALGLVFHEAQAGSISDGEAREIHKRITEVKIRLLGDRVSRWTAWTIATEQGWPDLEAAEYLAVTQLQADALVTGDADLIARAAGLVTVLPVTALAKP